LREPEGAAEVRPEQRPQGAPEQAGEGGEGRRRRGRRGRGGRRDGEGRPDAENGAADTLTAGMPMAAEVATASEGPIVDARAAAAEPSAAWPFPAPQGGEPAPGVMAVPAPSAAVAAPIVPVPAEPAPAVTMQAPAPVATMPEPPPAQPSAPVADLDEALRASGLVLIETDRTKAVVAAPEPEAAAAPRQRRERRPPPVGVNEPLVQVETKG
jgi:ribonuclease E